MNNDPETTENERELLVKFKNEIEVGKKDNDELLAELRRAIQVLAVDNLTKGISLSSGLSELSKTLTEFQNESERNNNLAIGLSSIAMFFRWFICLWCLVKWQKRSPELNRLSCILFFAIDYLIEISKKPLVYKTNGFQQFISSSLVQNSG